MELTNSRIKRWSIFSGKIGNKSIKITAKCGNINILNRLGI